MRIMGRMPLLAMLAGVVLAGPALAQGAYPTRSIEMIIPFTPGGGVDANARVVGAAMSKILGVTVVPVNKPGANGNVAAAAAAAARPDGYTIFYNSSSMVISRSMVKTLNYDLFKDFKPVSLTGSSVQAFVINPRKHPDVKTMQDFAAKLKANPKGLTYSSGGVGNISHLMAVLVLLELGTDAVHVPFPGGTEAITSVLSGESDFTIQSVTATKALVEDGRLKALAVSTKERTALMPDVPGMAESVLPGFDVGAWQGIVVPAATPDAIVERLQKAVVEAVGSDAVKKDFAASAMNAVAGASAAYSAFMREEDARWAKVIKAAGIQPQ